MEQTIEERAYKAVPDMLRFSDNYCSVFIDGYCRGAREQQKIDIDKACSWLRQHAAAVIKFGVGDIIRLKGSLVEYTITSISDSAYHGNGWKIGFDCEDDYELVEAADPTKALSVINIEAFRKAMGK